MQMGDDGQLRGQVRRSPPSPYILLRLKDPSSQARAFSDALIELCDGVVSRLGDAVIPASTATVASQCQSYVSWQRGKLSGQRCLVCAQKDLDCR